MNAAEVKAQLCSRIEEVCQLLLPGGKKKGNEWCAGSVAGEAGDSLKVHLGSSKPGVWKDYAGSADDTGDVLTLWEKVRGVDFATALKQAKEWLGVSDTRSEDFRPVVKQTKVYVRPKTDEIEPLTTGGDVYDYLTKERKLDPSALHKYKIQQQAHARRGAVIVFPIYEPSGKAIDLIKFLGVAREEGKKVIWATADSRPRLFGWQSIKGDARTVVICEGEIDCLTIAGWGFPCLSLPQGASNMDWIEHDFEALERFERVYICSDMDAPGHKAAEEISKRLGRERCYRVSIPGYKDANEALCSGKFEGPDFEDCIASARTLDPAELRSLGDMGDEIWENIYPTDQRHAGTEPPFRLDWRCRFGELSIWTGWSGHGKSHLLNQFLLHDAYQGENVCIASFEMPAAETGAKLAQMILGAIPERQNRLGLKPAEEFLAQRFWVVDHVGVMHWSKLLPLLKYAARRYGCTRFAIDSLLRCGVAEDDYNGQKQFVNELVEFAASYGHVHLVCHSRKSDDESKAPGKMDVRGAAAITDLTHNGFTVWRNKAKEVEAEESRLKNLPMSPLWEPAPDAQITMWKNRKTGAEPFQKLWLHRASAQFVDRRDSLPFGYIPALKARQNSTPHQHT